MFDLNLDGFEYLNRNVIRNTKGKVTMLTRKAMVTSSHDTVTSPNTSMPGILGLEKTPNHMALTSMDRNNETVAAVTLWHRVYLDLGEREKIEIQRWFCFRLFSRVW